MISFLLLTLLFIVSYLRFWQGRGTENYYTSKPIYISHRGVTKNNPENTIEAFKKKYGEGTAADLDYGKLTIIALCIYIAVQVS